MAGPNVSTRYLSVGANRYAATADWGENGEVAFAANSNICLWSPAVRSLFPSHDLQNRSAELWNFRTLKGSVTFSEGTQGM